MSDKFMLNGKEYNGSDESTEVFGVMDLFRKKDSDDLRTTAATMDDEHSIFYRKARLTYVIGTIVSVIIVLGCIAANVYVRIQYDNSHIHIGTLALISLGLFGVGIWIAFGGGAAAMKKINLCTKEVRGRVSTFRTTTAGRGKLKYFPIFEYTYNDMNYELKTSYSTSKKPTVGEAVRVFIDPANPKDGFETRSTLEAFRYMYIVGDIMVIISSMVFLCLHL